MNSAAFLSAVKQEITRLQQIQNLLENESVNVTPAGATKPISGKRGGMSEAGKARVAEAQRKRWAAKKAAAEAASAPAQKQASAPVKKSAKTVAAVPTAKKLEATATKTAAKKSAAPAKKVSAKKSSPATQPPAEKKAAGAKKNSVGQFAPKRQMRQQPNTKAPAEATELNAPVVDALPAVPEDGSSNE